MTPGPALSPAQQEQLLAERLELVGAGIRHTRRPRLFVDATVGWIAWQAGAPWAGALFFVAMSAGLWAREAWLDRQMARRRPPAQILAGLTQILLALSALHAAFIGAVFLKPLCSWHYLLTMVLVGNAMGAVTTVGGDARAYLRWVLIYGGALGLAWLSQQSLEGVIAASLMVLMFSVFIRHVQNEGETLQRLVRLNDDLRQARDRAERASESKTRFFAAASHDLRQPLTALSYQIATVQALASQQQDERLATLGQGLRRALQDSQALLDSLLEVSRLDAGAVTVDLQDVDLGDLLTRWSDDMRPQAEQQALQWHCVLPPPGEHLLTCTDPTLLKRVLGNLASNALKFTSEGHITVALRRDGRTAEISLEDSGPGIPLELQDRIFEEFYQVSNTSRNRAQGLGLGLSIVRRLANLLAMGLRLESAPGKGSRFILTLPLTNAAALQPATATPEPLQALQSPARRVLVVDDEEAIRESLAELLTTLGWSVRSAEDIPSALTCLAGAWQPEALVLDYRLRDNVSGLDALAAIRARGCKAKAWMITGETSPERVQEVLAAGLQVRHKPVDGLALAAEISAALCAEGR
ncbi:ATP-binding response regulator [Inhella gelatinilytica]|uniref:histidine kinase n=1 Tax=Inhella gelatinilytica TaxID=2795030 RepID=A0A931IXW0_9BURK|nr:ATP-binding protein [Inhella gelatinilytica]MBH9553601.1 response regulator [Inhella gelatinilytica]